MPPIPNVSVPQAVWVNPPGSVTLSSAGSTYVGTPTYQWSIIEHPAGATPSLSSTSVASPVLSGVTVRGTYIVFLKITDSTGSSHPAPYPTQATEAPYGFTTPISAAFAVVRVAEASGLVKTGKGQYGWLEDLWQVVDKVGSVNSDVESLQTNLGALETSVGSLETSVGALETNLGALETNLGALETSVGALETSVGALETSVGALETSVGALETSVGALETSVGSLETTVSEFYIEETKTLKANNLEPAVSNGSVSITAGGNLQLWGKGGSIATLPAQAADVSTSIRASKRIELVPATDTYTPKPIRAPGLVGSAIGTKISMFQVFEGGEPEEVFSGRIAANPNYTNAARFTKHTIGSEIRIEVLIEGVPGGLGSTLNPAMSILRHSTNPDASSLIFLESAPSDPGNDPHFYCKASVRFIILSASRAIAHFEFEGGSSAGVNSKSDILAFNYADPVDLSGPIWFDVRLHNAIESHTASITGSLFNPHQQEVL